jgi:arginase family enzyme
MELDKYFTPVILDNTQYDNYKWGSHIIAHTEGKFPELENCKLAIIGVGEGRRCLENFGTAGAPDKVREGLYELSYIAPLQVADLGNVIPGNKIKDTIIAVEYIVRELLERKIIPIIIGGGHFFTYPMYLAYKSVQSSINLVCVDRVIDLGKEEEEISSCSFLNRIIRDEAGLLFNLSMVAFQTHFANPDEMRALTDMNFDLYRLGQLQLNLEDAEPIVREADILSFDISAIRKSDAPGCFYSTPNGLYGEEACQIMRYAGLSDKVSSVGIFETNPEYDSHLQTSELAAQMVWYFMDGYANRKNDFPIVPGKEYLTYTVAMKKSGHEIIFYKSIKTDRWWMVVPHGVASKSKFERHHIVPCSYQDYLLACSDELPDRWWKTYLKLN